MFFRVNGEPKGLPRFINKFLMKTLLKTCKQRLYILHICEALPHSQVQEKYQDKNTIEHCTSTEIQTSRTPWVEKQQKPLMQNAADPRYKVAGREPKIGVWNVTGDMSSESVSSPCPVRPPTGYQKCPQSVAGPISVSPFPLRYLKGDRASKTESYKDSLVST